MRAYFFYTMNEHTEFDLKLLTIVHSLRPFEEVKIKKDEFGKPGRIIILTSSTTILDKELKEKQ